MTDETAVTIHLHLPLPARVPLPPLDAILSRSAEIFMAVASDPYRVEHPLEERIARADRFLTACSEQARSLREAMEAMPVDDVAHELIGFVSAWPNASGGDLAGYGAQLVKDVVEREPCRYAVREGLRKLRHTSRFLPSIAEVLEALDEAQRRVRNTSSHIAALPERITAAKAVLAEKQAREAMIAEARAAAAARREAEGKSTC